VEIVVYFSIETLCLSLECGLFIWEGQRRILHFSYCYLHSSCFLWHNLATERFKISVFLLGYLPATADEHYQSGFKIFHLVGVELHFVWPMAADLPGMGNPNRRFLSPLSSQYSSRRSWRRTNFSNAVRYSSSSWKRKSKSKTRSY